LEEILLLDLSQLKTIRSSEQLNTIIGDKKTAEIVDLFETKEEFFDDYLRFLSQHQQFLPAERKSYSKKIDPTAIYCNPIGYAYRAKKLVDIFQQLTLEFCLERCPIDIENDHLRCCQDNHHQRYAVFQELLQKEARLNGWKDLNEKDRCKYHNDKGCKLNLYRPLICLSFLCEQLEQNIKERYPLEQFSSRLCYLRSDEIIRNQQLNYLDQALLAGDKLKFFNFRTEFHI